MIRLAILATKAAILSTKLRILATKVATFSPKLGSLVTKVPSLVTRIAISATQIGIVFFIFLSFSMGIANLLDFLHGGIILPTLVRLALSVFTKDLPT